MFIIIKVVSSATLKYALFIRPNFPNRLASDVTKSDDMPVVTSVSVKPSAHVPVDSADRSRRVSAHAVRKMLS